MPRIETLSMMFCRFDRTRNVGDNIAPTANTPTTASASQALPRDRAARRLTRRPMPSTDRTGAATSDTAHLPEDHPLEHEHDGDQQQPLEDLLHVRPHARQREDVQEEPVDEGADQRPDDRAAGALERRAPEHRDRERR